MIAVAVHEGEEMQGDSTSVGAPLEVLEEEHRRLSARRRRLHESIDVMEQAVTLKPDSVALLERYKQSERSISWERAVMWRKLRELRAATPTEPRAAGPADDLLRRLQADPIEPISHPGGTVERDEAPHTEAGYA